MSDPNDITPLGEPEVAPLPPPTPPSVPPQPEAFWGWHDLFLFLFITVISLGVAMLAAIGLRQLLHIREPRMNIVFVIAQFSAYGISFTCLKLMFHAEYDAPLLRSLRWLRPRLDSVTLALIGLGQAFVIALLGALLSVPRMDTPMNRLLSDRPTAIVIAILGVTIAPLAEELAFRGLLQPLLIRTVGIVPGILGTSILFGAMHLEQYGSWQSVVLITAAGVGFGVMRQVTGSTRASALMHAGYNSALFLLFFAQKGAQH